MRKKLAVHVKCEVFLNKEKRGLTIHLSIFDFLEQALEPSERWCITTNPEEFDTPERVKFTFPLSVPNVLENRSKWSYT